MHLCPGAAGLVHLWPVAQSRGTAVPCACPEQGVLAVFSCGYFLQGTSVGGFNQPDFLKAGTAAQQKGREARSQPEGTTSLLPRKNPPPSSGDRGRAECV